MAMDPGLELIAARIERVLPLRDMAAVVLTAEAKRFMILVGLYESAALLRELRQEKSERPLTHDLIGYLLTGFDIEVEGVVISSLVRDVFCATLILQQRVPDSRPKVRLDVRASDSLVIAQKTGCPLFVTRRVLEQVEDVSAALERIDQDFSGSEESEPTSDA